MAAPSTPRKAVLIASHSTPFSRKVASVFTDRIRAQMDPLVAEELKGNILPASHEAFLQHALGVYPTLAEEWASDLMELGEHQQVRDCLADLLAAGDEKARYKPFAKLANFILDEMHQKYALPDDAIPDLRFVRNDPTIIKGPPEAHTPPRKPDIVLVNKKVADRLNEKQKPSSIAWTDIMCAIEFKVDAKAEDAEDAKDSGSATNPRKKRSKASGKIPSNSRLVPTSHKPTKPGGSYSAPTSTSRTVSRSGSSSKRKRLISVSADEPPTKKSRSGSRSGSVHTGGSGVTNANFQQLSSYPLEMLSSTRGTREHALSMFVDGDEMQLWFYDRVGAIHSDVRVNFRTDFVGFATIILACARLNLKKFGFLSAVTFPSTQEIPASLEDATIVLRDELDKEHIVTLTGDIISSRPGIVGRCSFVCGATCPTISNSSGLVIKFSFQDVTRANEVDIIKHAQAEGVEYLPTVYLSHDFACLSQLSRKDLIPENDPLPYQDRVLRIMISQRYTPVYKLPSLINFQSAIRDVFECMNQLLVKARVLHRDISYTNIMAEALTDGSYRGILIDFDLAVRLDRLSAEGPSSLHRTGTLPFMAVELLTAMPVSHTFQHDAESLFYVLVWIAARYDGSGNEIHPKALSKWQTGSDLDDIGAIKQHFVLLPSSLDALTCSTFYAGLKETWLKPFQNVVFSLHTQWGNRLRGLSTLVVSDGDLYNQVVEILRVH